MQKIHPFPIRAGGDPFWGTVESCMNGKNGCLQEIRREIFEGVEWEIRKQTKPIIGSTDSLLLSVGYYA